MSNNDDNSIEEDSVPEEEFDFEDEFNDDSTPDQKLKKLRVELRNCQKEKADNLAGWQRAKADYVNLKKQNEQALLDRDKIIKWRFIDDVLPTLDGFEMAMKNEETWKLVDENWRKGIEFIYGQFNKTLSDWGLTEITANKGDLLDHNLHESIQTKDTDNKENDHKIVEVLQKGYKLDDRVIRPSKVIVYIYQNN